jgi:hypothetical protein
MAKQELRPKPFHEVTSIRVNIIGHSFQKLLVVGFGSALYHFSRNSKTGTLWEEGYYLVFGVTRIDVLVVKVHNLFPMLLLHLSSNVLTEIADVPPRCPLGSFHGAHSGVPTLKKFIIDAVCGTQDVIHAW